MKNIFKLLSFWNFQSSKNRLFLLFLLFFSFEINAQNTDNEPPNLFKFHNKQSLSVNARRNAERFERNTNFIEINYAQIFDLKTNQKEGKVTFNMPNSKKIKLKTKNVVYENNKIKTWFGVEDEDDKEMAALSFVKEGCRGYVRVDNINYEIYPIGDNFHMITTLRQDKDAGCSLSEVKGKDTKKSNTININADGEHVLEYQNPVKDFTKKVDSNPTRIDPCDPIPNKIRILVYFTKSAVDSLPGGNVAAVAQNSIAQINQALINSGVPNRTVELIDVLPFPSSFTHAADGVPSDNADIQENMRKYLDFLRANTTVLFQKDALNADVVVFLARGNYFNRSLGTRIRGRVAGSSLDIHPSKDFSFLISDILESDAANSFTFAHEFAHLFQARHQQSSVFSGNSDNDGTFAHAFSWKTRTSCKFRAFGICITWNFDRRASILHSRGRRDDESDPATEYFRVLRYSNPNASFNGTLTGTSNNDNARQIRDQFPTIAFFEPEFPDFSVEIEGPTEVSPFEFYCLEGVTKCGTQPFSVISWEQSSDGFNFFNIGSSEQICVNAGNNNSIQFFRLTIVDAQGRARVATWTVSAFGNNQSPSPLVNTSDFSQKSIISPNPAQNIINIMFLPHSEESLKISLIDINGISVKEINKENINKEVPININLNVEEIPNGIYFIKIKGNSEHLVQKVIINH